VITFWSVIFAELANYVSGRQVCGTWFASVVPCGFNRVFTAADTYSCAVNPWNISASRDNINRPNVTVIRVGLYVTRNECDITEHYANDFKIIPCF
jgi:hypothetical protein